ncbi:MAG: preprotein translocase subunit YajC [Muribaculaceae bacterium]|jgi:preprotein translocase, YajC subunit|nr:preprotein translocase subunit YajC [Muribaculaceae bacterium]
MLNTILLQDASPMGGGFQGIIMIVAIFAIFYFMMVRPQQKRQKEIKKFRENLTVGDRVVTAGGIHGKISGIKDDHFRVKIADGVEIRVDKGSVYPAGTSQEEVQQTSEKK